MCLAVPGQIVEIGGDGADPLIGRVGTVDFQGSQLEVSLAMTPEVQLGDWVLVHAGFAITVLEEEDARQTWEYLNFEGLGEVPAELRQAPAAEAGGGEMGGEGG